MNVFKRKSVYAAVLASLGTMAVAGSAGAVQLSQDGTGQVLIYPYYTTRTSGVGDYNTLFNVVNTTDHVKVVKVRFLEGKNSREVLDFNLYLSPRDVWAANIVPTATGAKLNVTSASDNSCVSSAGGLFASGLNFNFTNNAYTGLSTDLGVTTGWDGADQTLDRTREGYIEIIEMGTLVNQNPGGVPSYLGTAGSTYLSPSAPTTKGLQIASGVTHNTAGVPANCANIAGAAAGDFWGPTGGIMGGASIINVTNGSDLAYDPVVLEDFNTVSPSAMWTAPGFITPDLTFATPASNVFYYHLATTGSYVTDVVANTWGVLTADAVSAVLQRDSVMNTYILDAATASKTDWVVTFPTKRHYISANNTARADTGTPVATDPEGVGSWRPFANSVVAAGTVIAAPAAAYFWNGFCNNIAIQLWDREESTPVVSTVEVSPPPPPGTATPNQLCWESNVITIANTAPATFTEALLGSHNGLAVTTANEHGWGQLTFTDAFNFIPTTYNAEGTQFNGLPVIGFMAQDFNAPVTINGGAATSVYGGNFNHRYTRTISGTGVR